MSSGEDIDALVRESSFIFSGTVERVGASNVPLVDPGATTLLVRVERGLRTSPSLGDVRGRLVTVESTSGADLEPGTQAVFFTDSLARGDEIAVAERTRIDAGRVDEVAAAVDRLPDMHLASRLQDAAAVVHATVTRTARVPGVSLERAAPWWAEATLDVLATLKGDTSGMRLLFPTNPSHRWYLSPQPAAGDSSVFLLHADEPPAQRWLVPPVPAGAVTALDPFDVQPESELAHVQQLLEGGAP